MRHKRFLLAACLLSLAATCCGAVVLRVPVSVEVAAPIGADPLAEFSGVLYFYADNCAPCRMQMPVLLKRILAIGASIRHIDVSAEPRLAERWHIKSLPVLVAVRESKELSRLTGLPSEGQLRKLAESVAPPPAKPAPIVRVPRWSEFLKGL